jgi:23S rRNA (pseudouridine1915-N3)-methyltransferase
VISIYTIEKNSRDEFEGILKNYEKMISKYSKLKYNSIFSNKISQAQDQTVELAQKSYEEAFLPHLKGFNVALHPEAKELDSFEFAKIFENNANINFFIGGAYGFNKSFLNRCDKTISLSKLTLSHKIAKVVLYEQIYRAYSIINRHPYHK